MPDNAVLLSDGSLVAWHGDSSGEAQLVHIARDGNLSRASGARLGLFNVALDATRFVSQDVPRRGRIYVCDATTGKRTCIAEDVSLAHVESGVPTSEDGRRLLLAKFERTGGRWQECLASTDVTSGKTRILARDVLLSDAAWMKDKKAVLYAAWSDSASATSVFRLDLASRTSTRLWTGGSDAVEPGSVRCSPDGEHVAYLVSRKGEEALVCESLKSRHKLEVVRQKVQSAQSIDMRWSRAGHRLAALLPGDHAAVLLFDNRTGKSKRIGLSCGSEDVLLLGWFPGETNAALLIASGHGERAEICRASWQ